MKTTATEKNVLNRPVGKGAPDENNSNAENCSTSASGIRGEH